MKNAIRLLEAMRNIAIIVLTAIIGFGVISCEQPTGNNGDPSHTHSYGSAWEYNATQHWHECSCGEKSDVANHTWIWDITEPATETEDGLKTEVCSACGMESGQTQVIPKGTPAPTVSTVTVSPDTANVAVGTMQNFTATVSGTNLEEEDKTVTWTIETGGVHGGTTIGSATGVLTVSSAETKTEIVIRATSTLNNSKYGEATVTVFDPVEALITKWYAFSDPTTHTDPAYYDFTDSDTFKKEGADSGYTFSASGDTITITGSFTYTAKFIIYETMLVIYDSNDTTLPYPTLRNGVYYKGGQATSNSTDNDFGTTPRTVFNVSTPAQWEAVRAYISSGATDGKFIINISDDITVTGDSAVTTFISEGTISIRGNKTIALTGTDNLLNIADYQTIILRGGITLQGNRTNDDSLVYIRGNSTLIMDGATIQGNSNSDGEGGGIYNNGGQLQIANGKIYGNDDMTSDEYNYANSGKHAVRGNVTLGTYANSTFSANGTTLSDQDDTIWIKNGKYIYSEIGNPPQYLGENVWYTSQDNANRRIGDTIEFIEDGRVFENGVYSGLTYSVNNTTITLAKSGVTESRTLSFNPAIFTLSLTGSGSLLAQNYFIPDPDYVPTFEISTGQEWANAINYANGKSGKLNFNIIASFNDAPGTTTSITAEADETLEITIKGIGETRTVALNSNGSLLRVGTGVTVTLGENLILQGKDANDRPLVYVYNNLIMNAGVKITGNTVTGAYSTMGSGVSVSVGTFTMNGGEISGNSAGGGGSPGYGGGVGVSGGTFLMNGGTITGNTAVAYSTSQATGGGVSVSGTRIGSPEAPVTPGTFRITNGTISGNTISGSGSGSQLSSIDSQIGSSIAQYGKDSTWTTIPQTVNGSSSYSNTTITVVNGALVP